MSIEHLTLIDRLTPRFIHYNASELGIENVDLSATAGTQHKSIALNLSGLLSFYVLVEWTDEGDFGEHKLQWEAQDEAGTVIVTEDLTDGQISGGTDQPGYGKLIFLPGLAPQSLTYTLLSGGVEYMPMAAPRGSLVVNVISPSVGTDAILSAQAIVVTMGQESPTDL